MGGHPLSSGMKRSRRKERRDQSRQKNRQTMDDHSHHDSYSGHSTDDGSLSGHDDSHIVSNSGQSRRNNEGTCSQFRGSVYHDLKSVERVFSLDPIVFSPFFELRFSSVSVFSPVITGVTNRGVYAFVVTGSVCCTFTT